MPALESVPDCDCVCAPPPADCLDCPVESHCGILPGDFIKPDPALTQRETRVYILEELQRWLTGSICQDAKDVDAADLESYLEAGTWPAARLYAVLQLLEKDHSYILPPASEMDRFQFVGQWAVSVCLDYLSGYEAGIPAAVLATGFVTTDKLPSGRTIESFWDYSPFERLREAPPLTEESEADIFPEADAEPREAEVKPSIDDHLDGVTQLFYKVLTSDLTIRIPVWTLAAAVGGVTAYLAVIVAAISRCSAR